MTFEDAVEIARNFNPNCRGRAEGRSDESQDGHNVANRLVMRTADLPVLESAAKSVSSPTLCIDHHGARVSQSKAGEFSSAEPSSSAVPLMIHGAAVFDRGTWLGVGRMYNLVFSSGEQTSICVAHGSSLSESVKLAVERFKK